MVWTVIGVAALIAVALLAFAKRGRAQGEPHATQAAVADPNRKAAEILRGLLDGRLSPGDARRRWPKEPIASHSAKSYIDYFSEGHRISEVDALVRSIILLLEAGPGTDPPVYDEALLVWKRRGRLGLPLREAAEVARRLLVLNLIGQRANLIARAFEDPSRAEQVRSVGEAMRGWLSATGLERALEPPERDLMALEIGEGAPSPEQRTLVLLGHWMSEAGVALAWSLGLVDEIPPPSAPGDHARIDDRLPRKPTEVARFIEEARLRPAEEIARARAHLRSLRREWKARRERHPTDREINLSNSRTLERYRALAWLTTPDAPGLWSTDPNASVPFDLDAPEGAWEDMARPERRAP